ncbi:MAG: hypothetical protein H6553_06785 [Chitinophagales bacterium]|nr:hypothetical protein [Chitinophagales bacterium]
MKEKEIYNVNKLQIFHTKMQMYRVIDEKTLKIKKSGLSEHCINSFYKTLNDNKKYITECVADKYEDIKRDSKRNNNEKNKE